MSGAYVFFTRERICTQGHFVLNLSYLHKVTIDEPSVLSSAPGDVDPGVHRRRELAEVSRATTWCLCYMSPCDVGARYATPSFEHVLNADKTILPLLATATASSGVRPRAKGKPPVGKPIGDVLRSQRLALKLQPLPAMSGQKTKVKRCSSVRKAQEEPVEQPGEQGGEEGDWRTPHGE